MQQAKDYYNIARIAMEADNCNELIVWGLTDAMTWRGGSNPLLYDSDLTPKPAYYDLHQGLRETSSTPTRITNHGLYKKKQPRRLYLLRSLFVSIIQLTSLDKEGNLLRSMLPIKSCFAYYQMYFCLLSNIALLTNKYSQI